jgi:PEGA domain
MQEGTPVSQITRSRLVLVAATAVAAMTALPLQAEAQRRGSVRTTRQVVYVGTYPRFAYYDPWFQWGPYGYPPPFGYYRYGMRDELTSSVRLEASPRQAEVFVDGYSAGVVDDFDGIFQRLRLQPGGHEITIYLAGYRTIQRSMYLNAGADQKLQLAMEPLRQGESAEPPPPPRVRSGGDDEDPGAPPAPRQGPAPRPRQAPPDPRDEPRQAPAQQERETRTSFGSLSLRVLPGDAEIFVDGERWGAPSGQERVVIQVAEGRHKVEVRKAGFVTYSEDVLIRRNATMTLNVSLLKG